MALRRLRPEGLGAVVEVDVIVKYTDRVTWEMGFEVTPSSTLKCLRQSSEIAQDEYWRICEKLIQRFTVQNDVNGVTCECHGTRARIFVDLCHEVKRARKSTPPSQGGQPDQKRLIEDIVGTILGSTKIPTPILDTDLRIFRKNRHVATIHLKSNQHTTSCWKSENGDWQEAACQRKLAFTVCPEAYDVPIPTLTRETLRAVTDVRAETPKRVFTSIASQYVPMIDFRKTREKYGSGYVVYVISNHHWPYDEHGCQFERGYNARIDLSF